MQPNNPKGAGGNETTGVPANQYHAGVDRTFSPDSNTSTAELSEQQVRHEREELEHMRPLDQELRNRYLACEKEETPARHRRPFPIIDSLCELWGSAKRPGLHTNAIAHVPKCAGAIQQSAFVSRDSCICSGCCICNDLRMHTVYYNTASAFQTLWDVPNFLSSRSFLIPVLSLLTSVYTEADKPADYC